jgi:hypothetical protein
LFLEPELRIMNMRRNPVPLPVNQIEISAGS